MARRSTAAAQSASGRPWRGRARARDLHERLRRLSRSPRSLEGAKLGTVEPNSKLGTDPGRLDSYTEAFRQRQLAELFAGTRFQFKHFVKTNGYANMPLDALWLRPYLHNGSVPTLRDLLAPPAERPSTFVRGIDVIDGKNGGFVSPSCTPGSRLAQGFCYDTRLPGNGNGGHTVGTTLPANEKDDLIADLLTF